MPGRRTRRVVAGLALLAAGAAPRPADALLLLTKSKNAASDGVAVVAVREGDHTVLSIQPSLRGTAGDVALLVPVPPALFEMKTLEPGALDPVSQVSGPRVAEYWEQDPCEFHDMSSTTDGTSDTTPAPPPSPRAGEVAYTTEVAQGKTGAEIVAALKRDGFVVPAALDRILDGYLQGGFKLVVARIDAGKLPREGDATALPPLEIHVRSDELTLPTRLLAAGGGRRELSAYVLSPDARYEAASQPNMAVPTNLDVGEGVLAARSAFYRSLVDRAFEQSKGAVLTEYAWRASSCELCAAPLPARTLGLLGGELLPSAALGKQHEVLLDAPDVATRPDGPDEARASLNDCYGKALSIKKGLAGEVKIAVAIGADGAIAEATPSGTPDDTLARCALDALRSSKGWKANARGTVTVTFSPVSRAFFSGVVLTALRARYDGVPDRDLTLAKARAIEGGREMGPEGSAEKRVYPAPAGNDFQARYVVRHPFAGPIACASPARGIWGGPPADRAAAARPDAPDAGVRLEALLPGGLPDLSAFAIHFGPPLPAPAAAPSASAPPASPAAPSPSASAPARSQGCGSCAVGSEPEDTQWPGAVLFAVAASMGARRAQHRRRRSRPRPRVAPGP